MDNCLRKGGIRNHDDGEEDVSVRRGHRCGCRGGRCHRMQERGTLLQMEGIQPATGRSQWSISDPYGKEGFLQL